jgi:hypothetical protein
MADERIDDAEAAGTRSARFGRLPARVTAGDVVETVETRRPGPGRPEAAGSEELRQALFAGG